MWHFKTSSYVCFSQKFLEIHMLHENKVWLRLGRITHTQKNGKGIFLNNGNINPKKTCMRQTSGDTDIVWSRKLVTPGLMLPGNKSVRFVLLIILRKILWPLKVGRKPTWNAYTAKWKYAKLLWTLEKCKGIQKGEHNQNRACGWC